MSNSNKEKIISFRVTKKELDIIEKMASKQGMNRSDYISYMCLMKNCSENENAAIFAFLEQANYYLLQLKNDEIDTKKFLKVMKTEIDHLWHTLK